MLAGRKSNIAKELATMGKAILTDNAMRQVLALIYSPCSHDLMQAWKIPLILPGEYFFYPWSLFPMEYAAAAHKKIDGAEYLKSKAKLNTSPVKEKRKKEALSREALLLGKAVLLFDPGAGRIKEHNFEIELKREFDMGTLKEESKLHIKFCHIK
ncbi:hypothetical protein ACFL54_09290 [Planctomycetota bacterium]